MCLGLLGMNYGRTHSRCNLINVVCRYRYCCRFTNDITVQIFFLTYNTKSLPNSLLHDLNDLRALCLIQAEMGKKLFEIKICVLNFYFK